MAPHHQKAGYFDQSRAKDQPLVPGLDADSHTNRSETRRRTARHGVEGPSSTPVEAHRLRPVIGWKRRCGHPGPRRSGDDSGDHVAWHGQHRRRRDSEPLRQGGVVVGEADAGHQVAVGVERRPARTGAVDTGAPGVLVAFLALGATELEPPRPPPSGVSLIDADQAAPGHRRGGPPRGPQSVAGSAAHWSGSCEKTSSRPAASWARSHANAARWRASSAMNGGSPSVSRARRQ